MTSKKNQAAAFAQNRLAIIRELSNKVGVPMPEFDDKTAAMAIAVLAKLSGDEQMYKAGKAAMEALA